MCRSRALPLFQVAFLFILGITFGLDACGNNGGVGMDSPSPPPNTTAPSPFPLRAEAGKRYLVDHEGKPFLLHGDAAWSLIAQATDAEVDQYLESRRQMGFNAILVNLLEKRFADRAPNNIANVPPFLTAGNYSTPNEAYFARADSVIRKAGAKGMLVMLAPSYLGYNGGNEGWYHDMVANGTIRMREYGRYLGRRYNKFKNILWVHGGDYNPPDKALTREIALGIKEFDTHSLHTAHGAPEASALGYWSGETWLQVNNIYTSSNVPMHAHAAYTNPMPFFLIESRYENEKMPEGTEQHVRGQAYQALLSGAFGQIFGNNPIWHFSSNTTIYPSSPPDWRSWLNSPGAMSMVNIRMLFAQRSWWLLRPDASNKLLTDGYLGLGGPYDLAVAAMASDGSFAIAYMPSARQVTVDLGQMAGPKVTARWYDPASGTFSTTRIPGSPFPISSGIQVLPPPPPPATMHLPLDHSQTGSSY
jgi:hypothetical protein